MFLWYCAVTNPHEPVHWWITDTALWIEEQFTTNKVWVCWWHGFKPLYDTHCTSIHTSFETSQKLSVLHLKEQQQLFWDGTPNSGTKNIHTFTHADASTWSAKGMHKYKHTYVNTKSEWPTNWDMLASFPGSQKREPDTYGKHMRAFLPKLSILPHILYQRWWCHGLKSQSSYLLWLKGAIQ